MSPAVRRATLGTMLFVSLAVAGATLVAQVTPERLLRAAQEPQNWLTYSGTYASQRYTTLRQVTPQNVRNLEQQWVLQGQVLGAWQSSPLVVDGIMYVTQRPNDVLALDARTGRVFWQYHYQNNPNQRVCCGANNRGVAIHGETLFMGTLDAHLVALDAKNGQVLWNVAVADVRQAYSITLAPLVIKDTVVIGVGGGEYGIRGFIAAYDVRTGKQAWRFETIPRPGQPGSETWKGDAWEHGGGSVWVTGSYDPELNLTYWGVGNPGPDWNPDQRPGDNLYTESVVALDATTGALKWHFQFTPNDPYDFDAVQVPVLVDMPWPDTAGKLMLWANRNGFFYVLDRVTGKFLKGHAVREDQLGERPRRQRAADADATARGLTDVAGQPGRHQLVLAVVQPAHRTVLRVGVARLRVMVPAAAADIHARAARFPAARTARWRRRRIRRPSASAAARPSTTGPTRSATAR